MPHLLIAGTTGSGKSVGDQRDDPVAALPPVAGQCKFILIDPKMLELSVYDGIPHLLAPVVTDPAKAVVGAEMDGPRDGGPLPRDVAARRAQHRRLQRPRRRGEAKGETLKRRVQTGFDRRRPADLRGTGARPAAAAADRRRRRRDGRPDDGRRQGDRGGGATPVADGARGGHPSDHGDAAALRRCHNRDDQGQFPDADQLPGDLQDRQPHDPGRARRRTAAGQGDMLFMAAGGRVTRVHGPFVSDERGRGGRPVAESAGRTAVHRRGHRGGRRGYAARSLGGWTTEDERRTLREAVAIVLNEGKASTSFVQRRLQIGYNRAARLVERMESEGLVSKADRVGRREVLAGDRAAV